MPELAWIERQAAAGERVFAFPLRGGQRFLTHTRIATPFPYLLTSPTFHTEDQVRRAARALEHDGPRLGVWEGSLDAPHLAPLAEVVRRDYLGEDLGGGLTGFRRDGPRQGGPR
ncbi:MAG TPA: hypothetical protein VFO85_15180 [Vicinamibacteria bacterium]|nr:hypothetical protein [Vicinamibacteria bacterium]